MAENGLLVREADVLADTFDYVRQLTRFYLSKAAPIDPHKHWEVNGATLNSLHWLVGHITWAENGLLIKGLTGESLDIDWLKDFEVGSTPKDPKDQPTIQEMMETMGKTHVHALEVIRSLDAAGLDEPNLTGMKGSTAPKRKTIQHAIRHEPCHAGHIGWLCKINGIHVV